MPKYFIGHLLTRREAAHYGLGMSTQSQFLQDIEKFLSGRKMADSTFGQKSVNDGKLLTRLRSGSDVTLGTMDKVRAFIEAELAKSDAAIEPKSIVADVNAREFRK